MNSGQKDLSQQQTITVLDQASSQAFSHQEKTSAGLGSGTHYLDPNKNNLGTNWFDLSKGNDQNNLSQQQRQQHMQSTLPVSRPMSFVSGGAGRASFTLEAVSEASERSEDETTNSLSRRSSMTNN